MDLYLDSAKLDEVQSAHATGKLAGLTINPSLAIQAITANGDYAEHVEKIYNIVGYNCHKSYQVIGKTKDEMLRAAYALVDAFKQYDGHGIKVGVLTAAHEEMKLAREGLETVRQLTKDGILVNITTIQRPEHMILAAYVAGDRPILVSPFLGRCDDLIQTCMGLRLGKEFQKSSYFPADGKPGFTDFYRNRSGVHMMARGAYGLYVMREEMGINHRARVLAASVRNANKEWTTDQSREAYHYWADILTSPNDVFHAAASDDFPWPERATPEGMQAFCSDITPDFIEHCIDVYEHGTPEEVYWLLFHPKTMEGFFGFADDGNMLTSFKNLVSK